MTGFPDLNNEEKLLISLCRMEFTGEQISEIGALINFITDWDKFVMLANEQGVIALVWYNFKKSGFIESVPEEQRERLRQGYLKNVARNTFLYRMLDEISALAKNEMHKIVLLKGISLEKNVYGNTGLRQMTDIDILVEEDKALKLRNVLIKNGFVTDPIISSFYEKRMFLDGKHLPEMYKNGISLEIHFKLFSEKGNQLTEEFIKRAQNISGTDVLYHPDPQLFFLYLVRHLDKHEKEGDFQLRLYTDLVVLLSSYFSSIIHEDLFIYAEQVGLGMILLEKLLLIQIYWNIQYPGWLISRISLIDAEPVKGKFILFLRNSGSNKLSRSGSSPLTTLKNIPGIMNKGLFITGYLCPSADYMKTKYNLRSRLAIIAFYPIRWIHIFLWLTGIRDEVLK